MTGTTRSPARAAAIRAAGAAPLVLNVFDAPSLGDAVEAARPEVVVHQLTDLPERLEPRLDGLVLRYGQLYGPGTWNAGPSGSAPVHVDAAARAAALTVARGEPGAYNIVEDSGAASNAKARSRLGWDPALR